MNGEELYEVRRRVARDEGVVLPLWITLRENDRRLWDKTADAIPIANTAQLAFLRGFVSAAAQLPRLLPPQMGRPWNKTKLPDDRRKR